MAVCLFPGSPSFSPLWGTTRFHHHVAPDVGGRLEGSRGRFGGGLRGRLVWSWRSRASMEWEPGKKAALEVEQREEEEEGVSIVSRINHIVNKSSRWITLLAVVAVVVWRRDDAAVWGVLGILLNAGNVKMLKRLINAERPASARHLKNDPGMPSSHAQNFGFIASYAALGYLSWQGLSPGAVLLSCFILLLGGYMAWLRIAEGLHTPAQVMVGAGLGSVSAGLWLHLWVSLVQGLVASHTWQRYALTSSFAIGTLVFVIVFLKDWRLSEK